ncbi:MAG: hypothetical protein LLG16_00465 [Euryarchaeota archaeon]|nr:hypothetical protein [Euryarchaeota archaeon]
MVSLFLDYCTLNDALRDASTLAKLRYLNKEGAVLFTSTTVVGEAMEMMSEGPKEGQYMLVDLLRDLQVKFLHPKREWVGVLVKLDLFLDERSASFVPASERAHLATAIANGIGIYVTSTPEARALTGIKGMDVHIKVLDMEGAVHLFKKI